jgi:integrase
MSNKKALQLNDKMIKALAKPKSKKWIRDGGGLALCLSTATTGSWRHWYYIYTSPETGKKCYKPLGTYPDMGLSAARDAVVLLAGNVANLVDPKAKDRREMEARVNADEEQRLQKEAEEKNITVEKLVDEYLTKHAEKKKSSWKEDRRILNKDVVPVLGDKKAKDITRRDIMNLLDGMSGRGDGIITNTFKIVRRMFRFAVKQEIIATTPCYAFEKGEELPRPVAKERNLTEAEVKTFMTGIDRCAISKEIRSIMKLILLTGQRPGEVTSMHKSEIDGRWWEFTPKETIITKQIPRKQRIYLTDMATQLIGNTKGKSFIFPSAVTKIDNDGNPIPAHITERAVAYALRRNLLTHKIKSKPKVKAVGKSKRKKPFVISEERKLNIEKFTPHDLRRTCATMLSEIGFFDEVVDAVLAHLKKGEIRTYNKNKYDKEKQQAMEAWELKLNSIISTKADCGDSLFESPEPAYSDNVVASK